jgi:hypothetical protein
MVDVGNDGDVAELHRAIRKRESRAFARVLRRNIVMKTPEAMGISPRKVAIRGRFRCVIYP